MEDNTIRADTLGEESMLARYRRADALQYATYFETMVLNADVIPRWIDDSDCFWYCRSSRISDGSRDLISTEYRLVDAKKATNVAAFDHELLAKALEEATGRSVDILTLPIQKLEFNLDGQYITFDAFDQRWQFGSTLKKLDQPEDYPYGWLVSPDGLKAAFIREHNLWVRTLDSGEERRLTHDGHLHYAYATSPESRDLLAGLRELEVEEGGGGLDLPAVEACWSPDSSRLFTFQTDEREVRKLPIVMHAPQDGSVAPRVSERKYPLSWDKHSAQFRLLVIDVATAKEIAVEYPPIQDSFPAWILFTSNLAWWSADGQYAYFVDMTRGQKAARIVRFDNLTGKSQVLFEESSSTFIELGVDYECPPMMRSLPETNELIWPSERSGWWHLYLYDLNTGELKNAITAGEWVVRDILYFDKEARELWIQVAGRVEDRNPYYCELVRVNIDTGAMEILVSSDHNYLIRKQSNMGISCTANFFITTRARVDEAPVTKLHDRQGKVLLTLEEADISGLPEGWQWPEPVKMKADDGTTDIYGVVFRPSDFDPTKKYPVLDAGMMMPFYSTLPTGAFLQGGPATFPDPQGNFLYMTMCAMAELGFIVTVIDGRGTTLRSKVFHDFGYDSFVESAGLVDHVAGIKQLAERYPYMDLDNVGIGGPCAQGNAAAVGLLEYPDFFKVGVVWAPWDPRLVRQGEVYCGLLAQSPIWCDADAVQRLEGKLLVVAGMLDQFFNSSVTFQLVDSLVKANKNVDLRLHPNGGHASGGVKNGVRYVWDYYVAHLRDEKPPKNYKLVTASEVAFPWVATEKVD